jgi:hypothetical protein
MHTTATTARLTKLAQAGILSTIRPILSKIWPYSRWIGAAALAAPTATYAINRIKGYDPERELQMRVPDNLLNTLTPRFTRRFFNQPENTAFSKLYQQMQR